MRSRRETSIRRKLVVLLALAIMPIGLFGLLTAIASYNRDRENLLKDIRLTADYVASERDRQLSEVGSVLTAVAATFNVAAASDPKCGEALRRILSTFPAYTNIGYLNGRGEMTCSAIALVTPVNAGDAAWFKSALAGERFAVSRVFTGQLTKQSIVSVAVPVWVAKSVVDGVLSASIKVRELSRPPVGLRYIEDSHSAVLDLTGDPIVSTRRDDTVGESWLPPPELVRERFRKNELVFTRATKLGAEYMYVMHPIALNRAISLMAVRMDDKIRSIWLNFAGVATLPLLMWAAAVGAAWLGVDRMIVRPIIRLQRVTRAYASGHLSYRQPTLRGAPKEIRDLGSRLNDMAEAIQRRNAELEATLERNRSLVREIHHRVKNNLQLIASMINARARATDREEEQELLAEIANRVRALAIVHSEFRGSDQAMAIDLHDVVRDIVAQHEIMIGNDQRIGLTLAEGCRASIDDAVPTALLISEILSAARQFGDDEDSGEIRIDIANGNDGNIAMTVRIDAADAAEIADPMASISARLVAALARQIGATVDVQGRNRVIVAVSIACAEPDDAAAG